MHTFFLRLSQLMAILGGLVLSALVLITCVSIAGRMLNTVLHSDAVMGVMPGLAAWLIEAGIGPVNGDFELVEAGMAFTIFAFLPLCQIGGSHASVDIFTAMMSKPMNRWLMAVIEVVFAAVLIIIAWELFQGTASKYRSGQTSLLLEYPVWRGYALSLVGAVVAAIVGVYVAVMRVREMVSGQELLPQDGGAEH